ncbi:hypothetical protein ASG92_22285 [Arthrobacter sp. Soil736]|uniref:phage tail sheath family protein n=1 Tax=Arthrobacter sp. Soil736 TaxID=1736395 RepID=UPI0006FB5C83|nr:phage tail sheath subtilisin-like domain-containing protein [Arthrobacter sp. Soil736]KRE60015.1 hypothetical protein ASG92_22285 [Arthrobacter sp. Soil736]
MPEYLTPGVYVEETSFRSRSIEGVPTSTLGITGLTAYGPVPYQLESPEVIMVPRPPLVTSYTEFERAFGGLSPVGDGPDKHNYVALAARAFFENGGRRLYVQRVFDFVNDANNNIDVAANFAALPLAAPPAATPTWWARWPGRAGNAVSIRSRFRRSKNVIVQRGGINVITGLAPGAAVEVIAAAPADDVLPVTGNIRIVMANAAGELGFDNAGAFAAVGAVTAAFHITLDIDVRFGADRVDTYSGLELGSQHPRSITTVLRAADPVDEFSLVWLDRSLPAGAPAGTPLPTDAEVLAAVLRTAGFRFLTGGTEGNALTPGLLKGEPSSPDDPKKAAKGLGALAEVDDIAIVAMPDTVRFDQPDAQKVAVDHLIGHCESLRYRIAVVDPPKDSSITGVRTFRSQFDSNYAAIYYPWIQTVDPSAKLDPGSPTSLLDVPPSGYAAGIYARTDVRRGVHKAPANEVVLGISKFKENITYDRQAVLNPEGVNALRFFPGRSNRIWGARTMTSDPEWKYVNVRRLFIYLEHSIEKSTQWAVFEPNNERLWGNIRQGIEDFLLVTWRTGALMGTKPEQAFFVRCDRTTMTQNDLDNGRLICLIGVAPTYPAEFVIFRIGQWTADSPQS